MGRRCRQRRVVGVSAVDGEPVETGQHFVLEHPCRGQRSLAVEEVEDRFGCHLLDRPIPYCPAEAMEQLSGGIEPHAQRPLAGQIGIDDVGQHHWTSPKSKAPTSRRAAMFTFA